MKSILLTTTALVAFAGAAAADGHISLTWSGTATAGVAREGGSDAGSEAVVDTVTSLLEAADVTIDPAIAGEDFPSGTVEVVIDSVVGDFIETAENLGFEAEAGITAEEEVAAAVAFLRTALPAAAADLTESEKSGRLSAAELTAAAAQVTAHLATLDQLFGAAAVETGDFEEYAEVNATVTGSVALDNGVTLSAAMSVDAGRGYDFADDDGFDAEKTNGVGFDSVKIDAGAYGTLQISPNDIAHLVDDDDDASVDVLYTNDLGVASVSFALDIDEDSDVEARSQSWSFASITTPASAPGVTPVVAEVTDAPAGSTIIAIPDISDTGNGIDDIDIDLDPFGAAGDTDYLVYTPAIAADVQWSAKVSAPVADIATVYAAIDEEGGYDVGASATIAGFDVTAKVKSEALAVAEDADAEFDLDVAYTISGLTIGGGWNSVEDDDQWDLRASYTMSGLTVAAYTDEGEDWEVTGSYDLGSGASIVGGVNYTEDAYVGVSFSF